MDNYNLPIYCQIEGNLLKDVVEIICTKFNNKKFIIVSDEFIYNKYAYIIEKKLKEKKKEIKVILIDSSSYDNALMIGEKALEGD